METRTTRTNLNQTDFISLANFESNDELAQKRLNALLAANAETAREKSLFKTEREKTEAEMMKTPLSAEQAYAYFGLLLGTFSPAAIFTRALLNDGNFRAEDFWIVGVLAIINLISAITGYFSGKIVGKIVGELERLSWTKMLLALPFIGILWGILAGGAGGVIVFLIGAFFGAMLGAAVGGIALPAFTILHRLLKRGNKIDRPQFLPLAFGVTFVICAFIIGL